MKPVAKIFTKDNPCTKLDIWTCFRGRRGFKSVQVDEAHSIIGLNAPRNMLSNGYVTREEVGGVLLYKLTAEGEKWLLTKFKSYLIAHPESIQVARNVPKDWNLV